MGAGVTIAVTLLATLYFGKQDSAEVNPKLITPFLRKRMNKYKYANRDQLNMEEVPMNQEEMNENDDSEGREHLKEQLNGHHLTEERNGHHLTQERNGHHLKEERNGHH